MKNKLKYVVLFIVLIVLCFFIISIKRYDIDEPPKKYSLRTESEQTKYVNFIKKYIKPQKLNLFLDANKIRFSMVRKYDTGIESIEWFKHEAYTELFNQMFDKNRKGYDDCPVTENFKNKFGNNLFEHFNFNDATDSFVSCVLAKDKELIVDEAGDFNVGEPGYIYYHHFHYTLDDEGNVDDVIFDYIEE